MDDRGGLRDLRRLKVIGVLAPIVFLAAFEAFRAGVIDATLDAPASNVAAVLLGVVAAFGFGLLIFMHIERAQQQVVRQNRELAIVNGVSTATTEGDLDVDAVLHDAILRLLAATGAVEASVLLHPLDPESGPDRTVTIRPPDRSDDALAGLERLVELPLSASGAAVGRLRLRVPATNSDLLPSPEVLHTIGHQLGTSLRVGQLVADLQSRRRDGHTFYEALLLTSNQAPLADTLASVVEGARERLNADEGHVCLTRPVLDALELDPRTDGALAGGVVCESPIQPDAGTPGSPDPAAREHRCPIGAPEGNSTSLRVPLWAPGELLGDLWVARRTGPLFTERDRRYLISLAGIAAIAIAAARLRQQERHSTILAERDRIARELHDSLAQVLGSTHLRLRRLLGGTALKDRPAVAAELGELADVAEEAYRDVREAILGLRETSRPRGFLEALQAYLDKYAMQSGLRVEFETTTVGHPALAVGSEIQVLRVIQEALANVRKHARATTARVRVTDAHPDGLMIVIEDDGRGFDPKAVHVHRDGGYGLQTMRERMELAGGSLRIDSSPDNGTRVVAIVPASPMSRAAATLADHR